MEFRVINLLSQQHVSADEQFACSGDSRFLTASPLTQVLKLSRAMELGDWTTINSLAAAFGIDDNEVFSLYSESIAWAVQMQPQANDVD